MQTLRYTKGFTLVETLVAITILIMVIVGPMTIAQKGVQNAYFANDQVTAVFLAQEAIEGVRELRDKVALDVYDGNRNVDTRSWFPDTCAYGCVYNPHQTTNVLSSCTGGTCAKLFLNDETGEYSHTTGSTYSPFSRIVTMDTSYAAATGGVLVNVRVTWQNKGSSKEVKLQTWVYDHYQRYEN
jgi:type II secretory pathway pseudopilin PulG